jgi:hypothetical protein
MKHILTPLALALVAPALFAQDRIPADLDALIPADASTLIYVAPLDELEEAVQGLLGVVAPDMAMMADADALLSEIAPAGFNIDLLDRSRPFAIAVGAITMATQNTAPRVFLIVPTTDAGQLDLSLPPHASRISGGYLGICETGPYPIGGGSDLPARLPDGLIAGTLDAEPIVKTFRPIAGFMLGMAKSGLIGEVGANPKLNDEARGVATDTIDAGFGFVDDVMDSLSSFDFGVDLVGTELRAGYAVHFTEGSPLTRFARTDGPTLGDMLKFLDTDAVANSAVGFDLGAFVRWAHPYIDQIFDAVLSSAAEEDLASDGEKIGPWESPREIFDVVRETTDAALDTLGWFGDGAATSVYFDGAEMRTAAWMHGVSAGQLADSIDSLAHVSLASLLGIQLERSRIGDATTVLTFSLDYETLGRNFDLGADELSEVRRSLAESGIGDTLNLSLTSIGSQTLMVYNGDRDSIAQALRGAKDRPGTASPLLQREAALLGNAYPYGFYHVNIGPFAAGIFRMAEQNGDATGAPAGLADKLQGLDIPLTFREGLTSERFFQGLSIDFAGIGPLVEMAMERENH